MKKFLCAGLFLIILAVRSIAQVPRLAVRPGREASFISMSVGYGADNRLLYLVRSTLRSLTCRAGRPRSISAATTSGVKRPLFVVVAGSVAVDASPWASTHKQYLAGI